MATVSVTAREVRFDGVAADASLLPKVRAVEVVRSRRPGGDADRRAEARWLVALATRVARAGRAAGCRISLPARAVVDPRPKACEYCQVVGICRISDESATAVEENIDE